MCACVHACECMYVMCTHVYMHVCKCVCMCARVHVCYMRLCGVHVCMYVCVRVCMCMCVCVRAFVCMWPCSFPHQQRRLSAVSKNGGLAEDSRIMKEAASGCGHWALSLGLEGLCQPRHQQQVKGASAWHMASWGCGSSSRSRAE